MNRIFSWTVGSFFRSIGRILSYFVIGGLIFFLLGKSGLISFLHVNAATFSVPVKKYQSSYFGVSNNTGLTEVAYGYVYDLTRSTSTSTINNRFFQFSTPINAQQFDYIQFDFLLGVPQYSELNNDSTITGRYCSRYDCTQYCATGNCAGMCEKYSCATYSSYTQGTINNNEIYPVELNELNFSVRMEYTDGNFAFCDIQNGKIICPTNRSSSIKGIDLYYNFHSDHIANATFILYRATEYFQIIDSTQAIQNQTQQQQQQHQEMMESNTTQAESEASDFFGNFTVEDHGGINAIITAPLSTIQSLLSNTCTNLVLPLPFVDEDIELPCMNAIYTEHFGLFFQLYQTIILAIISYRCLRSIFYDINGFTNPDDDRIEVMDL